MYSCYYQIRLFAESEKNDGTRTMRCGSSHSFDFISPVVTCGINGVLYLINTGTRLVPNFIELFHVPCHFYHLFSKLKTTEAPDTWTATSDKKNNETSIQMQLDYSCLL